MIDVHGFTRDGSIDVTLNGQRWIVPDIDDGSGMRSLVAAWEAEGNTIPAYAEPSPTALEVDGERDRRIAAGFVYGGVHYQSRPEDRENIAGAKAAATDAITIYGAEPGNFAWQRLLDASAPPEFRWIAADNTTHPMDAHTAMRFGYAALSHKQAHIFAARALKDMDPIPADYAANPAYWP